MTRQAPETPATAASRSARYRESGAVLYAVLRAPDAAEALATIRAQAAEQGVPMQTLVGRALVAWVAGGAK